MENAKKQLKTVSMVILACLALSAIRVILNIILGTDIPENEIPEGLTAELVKITIMVANIGSLIFLLPVLYVGMKGLKIAKSPDASQAHIIWAIILLVLSVIGAISSASALVGAQNVLENVLSLIISVCEVALYYFFVKYAKQIKNEYNG